MVLSSNRFDQCLLLGESPPWLYSNRRVSPNSNFVLKCCAKATENSKEDRYHIPPIPAQTITPRPDCPGTHYMGSGRIRTHIEE